MEKEIKQTRVWIGRTGIKYKVTEIFKDIKPLKEIMADIIYQDMKRKEKENSEKV